VARPSLSGRIDGGSMLGVVPLVLRRTEVRKELAEELRACVASARLDPKNVRVQLVFGEANADRQPTLAFRIEEDEAVLGVYRTTHDTSAGSQPVLVGFIVPCSMLPPLRLDDAGRQRLAEVLADLLIAELERRGHLPPRLHSPTRSRRGW